ncbi:MAG: hypothetical protein ACRDKA_06335 [Actinomycetota bacterium]
MTWYDALREQYRPETVQVLFVGESPPDPKDAERRFFYSPTLFKADNLFRGVMKALYDAQSPQLAGRKTWWLERFKADGFWLMDLTDRPVNTMPSRERRQARREAVPQAIERLRDAAPLLGVVVCQRPTFEVLARPFRADGGGVLHDRPIPFPLGNHRDRFVDLVREALRRVGVEVPLRH